MLLITLVVISLEAPFALKENIFLNIKTEGVEGRAFGFGSNRKRDGNAADRDSNFSLISKAKMFQNEDKNSGFLFAFYKEVEILSQ